MTDTKLSSYERMTVAELRALANTRELVYTTKTRKPELIALHEEYDAKFHEARELLSKPETGEALDKAFFQLGAKGNGKTQMYIAPIGTPEEEMVVEAFRVMSEPVRHGALKLSPAQMRINYARQNARNPNLSPRECMGVKLTKRQAKAISRRINRFGYDSDLYKPLECK